MAEFDLRYIVDDQTLIGLCKYCLSPCGCQLVDFLFLEVTLMNFHAAEILTSGLQLAFQLLGYSGSSTKEASKSEGVYPLQFVQQAAYVVLG